MSALLIPEIAAADWKILTTDSDGNVVQYEVTTIKAGYRPNLRTAWLQWLYKKATKDGITTSKEKVQVDCSADSLGQLAVINYNAAGTVVDSRDENPVLVNMLSQAPGTVGEVVSRVICA